MTYEDEVDLEFSYMLWQLCPGRYQYGLKGSGGWNVWRRVRVLLMADRDS